jgi:putative hemolysin
MHEPHRENGTGIDDWLLAEGRYRVRYAIGEADLTAVQRLRYEVFNLELGEGLAESDQTGLDSDRYDRQCQHLMVIEEETGILAGTYRMQTAQMAREGNGFYSAMEFDLERFPTGFLNDAIELGRACIDAKHRDTGVLFLLWRGIAAFLAQSRKRYLFGCSSLTSQNPDEGSRLMARLIAENHVQPDFRIPVHPGYECDGSAEGPPVRIPGLFRSYLKFGARVCSDPALDREFKTIDFLVLLDSQTLSPFTRRIFFSPDRNTIGQRERR